MSLSRLVKTWSSTEIASSKPTYPQIKYDWDKLSTNSMMHRTISEYAIKLKLSGPVNPQDIVPGYLQVIVHDLRIRTAFLEKSKEIVQSSTNEMIAFP